MNTSFKKKSHLFFSREMVQAILNGRKTQTRLLRFEGMGNLIGETLWVRETWKIGEHHECGYYKPCRMHLVGKPIYAADFEDWRKFAKWKPSSHMPRKYARIFLRVESAHLESLNEISEADAMAEGYDPASFNGPESFRKYDASYWFKNLWNKTYGDGAWEKNPTVCVVNFSVVGGAK